MLTTHTYIPNEGSTPPDREVSRPARETEEVFDIESKRTISNRNFGFEMRSIATSAEADVIMLNHTWAQIRNELMSFHHPQKVRLRSHVNAQHATIDSIHVCATYHRDASQTAG
jgi:hypothetical protein